MRRYSFIDGLNVKQSTLRRKEFLSKKWMLYSVKVSSYPSSLGANTDPPMQRNASSVKKKWKKKSMRMRPFFAAALRPVTGQ